MAAKDKCLKQLPSLFDDYLDVLARLGYNVSLDFQSLFPPTGGNLRLVSDRIGEKKMFQQWIGIAPFAAFRGKVYPAQLTERVIAELIRRHPSCRIFLFGGGDAEMKQIDRWCAQYKNCTNASQLLGSVQQELIVMSHLDVMLSMDSVNMHLASIAGTRVVSLWGATHPYAGYLGYGQSQDDVIQTDLDCRPCSLHGNRLCKRGDYACLTQIDPIAVADHVEKHLKH